MAKANKETVYLVSSEGTNAVYMAYKKKGKPKISVKKYDPVARKHVLFEEKKVSRLKKKFKQPEAAV